jgi:hypothetical protein
MKHTTIHLLGRVSYLVVLGLIVLLVTSCDGYFHAEGIVYEWLDAPADSVGEIYVDLDAPTNRNVNPIPAVDLSFVPIGARTDTEESIWTVKATTDSEGKFQGGEVVAPGIIMMSITVRKEGYTNLSGEFQNDGGRGDHKMTIFLVRMQP